MFFGLHQKSGEHGPVACKKVDSAKRRPAPMGFFVGIDERVSEGSLLVN